MKVSIEHGEYSTGMIIKKKWPQVTVKVVFNEEEKAIIQKRKLEKYVVMEREWPAHTGTMPGDYNLTIGNLYKNQLTEYTLHNASQAKEYEDELIGRLKRLKDFLAENATPGENKSFEL